MNRLTTKVAIVTGAASGMGRAAAEAFAAEGARVVATDLDEAALQESFSNVPKTAGEIWTQPLDVASADDWTKVVSATLARWSGIDVLVNNAGLHKALGILETELADWNQVMAVNATSHWLGMREVIPHMKQSGGGSIITVSSVAGLVGGRTADAGGAAYAASKGATHALTKHAAQAFAGDRIRVNSIHPGPIDTGMTRGAGLSREALTDETAVPLPPHVGDASDIAFAMVYLASDESRFVTGTELVVDGGFISH